MADYRIAADVVALSKINELLEIKRRREDEAARIALLTQTLGLSLEDRARVVKSIMILEEHGLRTAEALEIFMKIMNEWTNNKEENNE